MQALSERVHELDRKWAFMRGSIVAASPERAAARATHHADALPRMPGAAPAPAATQQEVPAPGTTADAAGGSSATGSRSSTHASTSAGALGASIAGSEGNGERCLTAQPPSSDAAAGSGLGVGQDAAALDAATRALALAYPALLSEPLALVVGPRVTYAQ